MKFVKKYPRAKVKLDRRFRDWDIYILETPGEPTGRKSWTATEINMVEAGNYASALVEAARHDLERVCS